MPYFEDDKDTTRSMKRAYKGIADSSYTPAQDVGMPKTLEDFAEMEAGILDENRMKIGEIISTGKGAENIPALMSQASSAIEGLDEIVHIKRNLVKQKT